MKSSIVIIYLYLPGAELLFSKKVEIKYTTLYARKNPQHSSLKGNAILLKVVSDNL